MQKSYKKQKTCEKKEETWANILLSKRALRDVLSLFLFLFLSLRVFYFYNKEARASKNDDDLTIALLLLLLLLLSLSEEIRRREIAGR